jgi:hypothetical protein
LRLVVPGWTGTYWIKLLTSIEVRSKPLDEFWMTSANRLPKGLFPVVRGFTSQATEINTPIPEIVTNSLITNLVDGDKVAAGQPLEVKGIAWDGGFGIDTVGVSVDGGQSWRPAALGEDLGRFSFRPWSYQFVPEAGTHVVTVKATNRLGQSQPREAIPNPADYHHNPVQTISSRSDREESAMRALMMLAALLIAVPASAGEQDIVPKEGQGRDLIAANGQICHSLDYIQINSPFLDQKKWEATVEKMIERYGAPIQAENVPAIVSYLSTNYVSQGTP